MLRNTDRSPVRRGTPGDGKRGSDGVPCSLIDGLQELGFRVPPLYGSLNNMAGGVPLEVRVRELLRRNSASGVQANAIRAVLEDCIPSTLALSHLGKGDEAVGTVQRFCDFLCREVMNSGSSGEHVGICIQARQLPLGAFQAVTQHFPGPRYILLDDVPPAQYEEASLARENEWSLLWRHRRGPAALRPVYGALVRTGCPLLADEAAAAVLPVHGIQVPAGSAWFPLSLSLPDFSGADGEIDWDGLCHSLAGGIELAEKIMPRLDWPYSGQRADADMNRRLAISVTGLGDLVVRRGGDPRDLDTLRWLTEIVLRIRSFLWSSSGRMAQEWGCLPALHLNDPSNRWQDGAHRDHWRRRWQQALYKSAVRHRNLFVLSPYSILPSAGLVSAGYTDLLPVIAFADAWSFAEVPRFCAWHFEEFRNFHRRAWAVIRGTRGGSLVAAGV